MEKFKILILVVLFSGKLSGQTDDCDYRYEHTFPVGKNSIIPVTKVQEDYLNDILLTCPDHERTHKAIQEIREYYCISIPIMSLLWRNSANPYSEEAKRNIKKINKLSERYLSYNSKGIKMAIPEQFVKDWDADYENNISNLEVAFTIIGIVNHDSEKGNANSADRLMTAFDKIFLKADSTRSNYYGFYYEFYYDYFWNIYKSEHYKTVMYLIMAATKEDEIVNWINENSEKVKAFYIWRNNYLAELSL